MKRSILIIGMLFCVGFCKGQSSIYLKTTPSYGGSVPFQDCGTWQDKITYGAWQSIDTLSKTPIKDTVRNWIYNIIEDIIGRGFGTPAIYCPCGCMFDSHWWQYRVCNLTGIRQRRIKTQSWTLIPPPAKPKSEYERTIDSLSTHK